MSGRSTWAATRLFEGSTPVADKDPKLAAITSVFDAYSRDDRAGIAAVLADDVEWSIPGHHPLSGTKRGVDEVMAFFAALAVDRLPSGHLLSRVER